MKKIKFTGIAIFIAITGFAQDINLNFTASGESSSIDSIRIYNMEKDESLTIAGGDILHLSPTGIDSEFAEKIDLKIYPNPADKCSRISFNNTTGSLSLISIYDINGRELIKTANTIKGLQTYEISGLSGGVYMVKTEIDGKSASSKLIINNSTSNKPQISLKENLQVNNTKSTKSERATIDMNYSYHEYLKITAYSGNLATTRVEKPMTNMSLDFKFYDCTDYNGNYYPAVMVGDQVWTRENLKSENNASGNPVTRHCYNGQTSNCNTYGGLYTWDAMMNGESASNNNPSGVQGICPNGWHLPSDDEWKQIEIELGMSVSDANSTGDRGLDEGSELAGNSDLWSNNLLTGDGDFGTSGFDALPGGIFDNISGDYYLQQHTYFWTCSQYSGTHSWIRKIIYNMTRSLRTNSNNENGLSVRCVKD